MAGLPVGTGRLAAMVLGGSAEERIALNHDWLWRAARVALDRRLAHGGGHTGWSRSWVACGPAAASR